MVVQSVPTMEEERRGEKRQESPMDEELGMTMETVHSPLTRDHCRVSSSLQGK